MKNLSAILKAARVGLGQVVQITAYLSNLDDYSGFNRVYEAYLGEAKPARATVQVSGLPKGALLEVGAIAAD